MEVVWRVLLGKSELVKLYNRALGNICHKTTERVARVFPSVGESSFFLFQHKLGSNSQFLVANLNHGRKDQVLILLLF